MRKKAENAWMLWLFKQDDNKNTKEVSYRFWQPDNHVEGCISLSFAWQKLTYIYITILYEQA